MTEEQSKRRWLLPVFFLPLIVLEREDYFLTLHFNNQLIKNITDSGGSRGAPPPLLVLGEKRRNDRRKKGRLCKQNKSGPPPWLEVWIRHLHNTFKQRILNNVYQLCCCQSRSDAMNEKRASYSPCLVIPGKQINVLRNTSFLLEIKEHNIIVTFHQMFPIVLISFKLQDTKTEKIISYQKYYKLLQLRQSTTNFQF